jgi:hypothetical protein
MRRFRPWLVFAIFVSIPMLAHADEYTLEGRTNNLFAPTGQTVGKGNWELNIQDFGLGTFEYGVSDRLDIFVSSLVVPVLVEGGARLAVLGGRSPLKLTVQGGVITPTFDWADFGGVVYDVGATVAYATPSLNIHSSVYYYGSSSQGTPEDGLGVLSAGVTLKVGARFAIEADVTQLGARANLFFSDGDFQSAVAFAHIFSGGLKFLDHRFDVELGGMAIAGGDGVTGAPMVNVTFRN